MQNSFRGKWEFPLSWIIKILSVWSPGSAMLKCHVVGVLRPITCVLAKLNQGSRHLGLLGTGDFNMLLPREQPSLGTERGIYSSYVISNIKCFFLHSSVTSKTVSTFLGFERRDLEIGLTFL